MRQPRLQGLPKARPAPGRASMWRMETPWPYGSQKTRHDGGDRVHLILAEAARPANHFKSKSFVCFPETTVYLSGVVLPSAYCCGILTDEAILALLGSKPCGTCTSLGTLPFPAGGPPLLNGPPPATAIGTVMVTLASPKGTSSTVYLPS